MSPQEQYRFLALRKQVEVTFKERHPHCQVPIEEWKGQWIVDFQEDLLASVQGRVSEKWFYTWFRKSEIEKLPRIDMLNLLSRYVGAENWAGFKGMVPPAPETPTPTSRRNWWWGAAAACLLVLITTLLLGFGQGNVKFELRFLDAFTRSSLEYEPDAAVLMEGEKWKPLTLRNGVAQVKAQPGNLIRIAVSGGYCQTDTLDIHLPEEEKSVDILVRPDDYAIMIHIFSRSNLKDWRTRRDKLNKMMADDAEIFQVDPADQLGMEMFNKAEFVNQLTMPVQGLKDIQILETRHNAVGQIQSLRFTRGTAP